MLTNSIDFSKLRSDFPIFKQFNRKKPLIYLDSGASTQKPYPVLNAIQRFYSDDYANIHRGIYELCERATRCYDEVREAVRDFIHAKYLDEIIFVRGTTEGINLVAQSYGRTHFKAGDEVILSEMEHHSNIVPWFLLKEQIGIELKVTPVTDQGELDIDAYKKLFSAKTKMVALTHVSNVLGTINPVKELTTIAHEHGVPILLDGAQGAPHLPVNVADIDCDFYTFSAHKMYGPTGVGVLYGKRSYLANMPPYQGGGDMIEEVSFDHVRYAASPNKFEAGTPNIAGTVGLGEAISYLKKIGMDAIFDHEQQLLNYAQDKLQAISTLHFIGTATPKVGVISFVMDDIHPHDIGTVLDHEGIAVRAGHHCAMPLMTRYQVPATVRVSLGIYNEENDIDALVKGLELVKRLFL